MVHVAGTNGKGSFLAFTRAIAEALGKGVHVYTSPHLVNFHERIVLAGAARLRADRRGLVWSIASPAPKPPMAAS